MHRREFVLGTAAVATGSARANAQAPGGLQRSYELNRGWIFQGKGAAERVSLPHSNVVLPWHSFDDNAFQFISNYTRRFKALPAWRERRVFADFDGVMTAAKVKINAHAFDEYRGGYTPFSVELTDHLTSTGENVLTVSVDSTERADIPPFGGNIDYLTFGGIYRDVRLRVVPKTFIENVYAKPANVLESSRRLEVRTFVAGNPGGAKLDVAVLDGERVVASGSRTLEAGAPHYDLTIDRLGSVELWELSKPKLYTVRVKLTNADGTVDEYTTRIGFREAKFTPAGFMLNGKPVKLRGLNRHQTYPYVGGAMPARVQRRDAWILKQELKCNIVRTSHYPQSTSFLDRCDEIGLLVFEEIPGWQHIGDKAWKDLAVRNVGEMIRRDWNHPSIMLWGVRINESQDDHDLYTRTNALAHSLDNARQTGGVRYIYDSERLEDVFTMNDFGFPLQKPNHPLYLNTEFNGHMFSTKRFDNVERVAEHVLRHARVHNQLASDDRYAGGIAWCAFDYNTHANFGSGDHICYHGVSDIFRIPKPAAGVYRSQCDPQEEIVIEPGFFWASGDRSTAGGPGRVPICSNCEHLKLYLDGVLKWEADPDRKNYGNLKYPPFIVEIVDLPLNPWGDLKIEGYIGGKLVKTLILSGRGVDADLKVEPDDTELIADGRDATRVVLRITDEHGNIRPFATGSVALRVTGPADIIGENPFALAGGGGAVWLRAKESPGIVRLEATHPYLGTRKVEVRVKAGEAEAI